MNSGRKLASLSQRPDPSGKSSRDDVSSLVWGGNSVLLRNSGEWTRGAGDCLKTAGPQPCSPTPPAPATTVEAPRKTELTFFGTGGVWGGDGVKQFLSHRTSQGVGSLRPTLIGLVS